MWPKSPLFKLNPVFDEDGGICSNGRLQFAEYLPYGVRFPKIMLRGHWVTKLIIKHYYEQANHSAGTKFLLQHVQTKEEQVINTDHDSICFPRSTWGSLSIPLTKQQWTMLGLLPRYREDLHHKKRWLCLLTIAVHLEIAFGLDTDSFLNAFTGKTSRRGVPKEMIGNCGTNFVGAVSELKELISKLDQKKIQQDTAYQAVKWNFKTASNHWGANYCCCWSWESTKLSSTYLPASWPTRCCTACPKPFPTWTAWWPICTWNRRHHKVQTTQMMAKTFHQSKSCGKSCWFVRQQLVLKPWLIF